MCKAQLKVPFIERLSDEDLQKSTDLLETLGSSAAIDCINWEEYDHKPEVTFEIGRSKTHLMIHYSVKGLSLRSMATEDDQPVHKDSCVEFFVSLPDGKRYLNFEFNCSGVCDAARRFSREKKESLSADEYASIKRWSTVEERGFEEKEGLFAWELTVAIPFKLLDLDGEHLPKHLRANFYKCADETAYPHFLSWNAIEVPTPDFHRPEFFGILLME